MHEATRPPLFKVMAARGSVPCQGEDSVINERGIKSDTPTVIILLLNEKVDANIGKFELIAKN